MLQNAYLVAKIGADTAENEQHSAEILPTDPYSLGLCAGDRVLSGQATPTSVPPGDAAARSRARAKTAL